jgi:nicotinamidase-related amidase
LIDYNYDFIIDNNGPKGISIKSWLEKEKLALILIDVQNYITNKKYSGKWSSNSQDDYYYNRITKIVLPNIGKIIKKFRNLKLKIVYTRIASMNKNLSDVPGIGRKVLAEELMDAESNQYQLYYTEYAAMIDSKITPEKEDIVIIKSSSGAFCSSNMDLILRSNNISRLIFVGGLTDACVSSSVREAYDRGYLCTVIEDACIAPSKEDHSAALKSLDKYYAWVISTENLISNLK